MQEGRTAVVVHGMLRSPVGRGAAVAFAASVLLGALTTVPAPVVAQPPARLAATPGWLSRFNVWRSSAGLPILGENTTWDTGDYDHSLYMVKNDLVTHYETPGTPYYTTDGDTAARNGNIFVSSTTSTTDEQAIDWWMGAPFHSMNMMDPRLVNTGFGSYREVKSGWDMGATLDTIRGNTFSGGNYPVYFPGNGATEPLTEYSGNEFPDPLQACPGYAMPTGLPVYVEVGGNVNTTVGANSFTGNGVALSHCVIDSSNASVGSYLYTRGAVVLVPQQPLQSGVKYAVSLTVNGVAYSWSFMVGPFPVAACTTVSATPDRASPQAVGTTITFSATSTGCSNPQYRFYVLPPGGVWTVMRDYGAPSWAWITTGLATGDYLVDIWVRDAASGASFQAYELIPYHLGAGCGGLTLTPDRASPQQVDFKVTFTAASSGCANPQYQFFLKTPAGTWYLQQTWGSATWSWDTSTVASIGDYTVDVWVRPAGGSVAQAYLLLPFTLTNRVCTAAAWGATPASPQVHGTTVTFTATSSSCARPEYLFYLKGPGANAGWYVVQGYGGPTWSWDTAGVASIGAYTVDVWVRAVGSGAAYQSYALASYTLT